MASLKYAYIAMVGWGFWAIGSKLLGKYFNAENISFWVSSWSLVGIAAFVLFKRALIVNQYSLLALPVGVCSMIAILSFYRALQVCPTSVAVCLSNLYLVFPVAFGVIFLKEAITLPRAIGIVLAIAAGVLLSI